MRSAVSAEFDNRQLQCGRLLLKQPQQLFRFLGFGLDEFLRKQLARPAAYGTKGQQETIPAFSIFQVISLPIPAPSR
jgi:hypothetical protein